MDNLIKKIYSETDNNKHNTMKNIRHKYKDNNFETETFSKYCSEYNYQPAIMNAVSRIVVLGDIHGDYELAINMLTIAKVIKIINDTILWSGNDTYVVQVGDQIDSCRPFDNLQCNNPETTINDKPDDIKILKLFTNLHSQAIKSGGAVISLLGNHEILNASGQMNYVSYKNLEDNNGLKGRIEMFKPGNEMGKFLGCTRNSAVIIGSNLFVHAGIIDGLINEIGISTTNGKDDIALIDIAIRHWLLGLEDRKIVRNIINSTDKSIFWTRKLGYIKPNEPANNPTCMANLELVLETFGINRIIIGHTPQSFTFSKKINGTCGNKLIRVDNGSSMAFHRFDNIYMSSNVVSEGRIPQVLEILNDEIVNISFMHNNNIVTEPINNINFDVDRSITISSSDVDIEVEKIGFVGKKLLRSRIHKHNKNITINR